MDRPRGRTIAQLCGLRLSTTVNIRPHKQNSEQIPGRKIVLMVLGESQEVPGLTGEVCAWEKGRNKSPESRKWKRRLTIAQQDLNSEKKERGRCESISR